MSIHGPMDPHDLQISDNMWAFARRKEAEYHAALKAARSFDIKHDLPWPCDLPAVGGPWGAVCGARGLCPHHAD